MLNSKIQQRFKRIKENLNPKVIFSILFKKNQPISPKTKHSIRHDNKTKRRFLTEFKNRPILRLFSLVFVVFSVPFIVGLFYSFYVNQISGHITDQWQQPFWKEVHSFYTGFLGLFTGFITALIGLFRFIKDQFVSQFKEVSNDLSEKVDKHLQKTKIVFESGIVDYDEKYLSVIQKILTEFDTKFAELKSDGTKNDRIVNDLYFIDHSLPIKWWSESMTGYMALLAKWRANGPNRKVRRFFIYSGNELLSPVTVKTIAFHSLMGFNTYVFSEKHFNGLFKEFSELKKAALIIKKKELFIWNNSFDNHINFTSNDNISWSQIVFYQSFWNINEHAKNERGILIDTKDYIWLDYLNNHKKSSEINTWFEFVPKNSISKTMAEQFSEFLALLKENTYCCMYKNDIIKIPKTNPNFGIKIKSIDCHLCKNDYDTNERCVSTSEKNGTNFGYTNSNNIADILLEYSKY